MQVYTVDIGSFYSGRTIEITAKSPRHAYSIAKNQLNQRTCEKIIQIRDGVYFYYDCQEGFRR